jgi:hypothetical protein
MPRLKKKNIQAAPVVPVVSVENFGVTMTFRQAAKHYGVKISSIRNTVKDYGLDAPRMGKYKIVRLTDLEVVLAKKAVCDKLNADPLFRELPPANRWRWEPERKKWGPSTTSVMGPYMALRRAVESGLVRWSEGQPGSLPLNFLFGLRVQAQIQTGAIWFRLLDKGMERRSVAVQILRMSAEQVPS